MIRVKDGKIRVAGISYGIGETINDLPPEEEERLVALDVATLENADAGIKVIDQESQTTVEENAVEPGTDSQGTEPAAEDEIAAGPSTSADDAEVAGVKAKATSKGAS